MWPLLSLPLAFNYQPTPTPLANVEQHDLGPGGCASSTLKPCSGHGRCGAQGVCRCDRGFAGAGCERAEYLLACPSNCSYPAGKCVGSTCSCASGFSGDDCVSAQAGSNHPDAPRRLHCTPTRVLPPALHRRRTPSSTAPRAALATASARTAAASARRASTGATASSAVRAT